MTMDSTAEYGTAHQGVAYMTCTMLYTEPEEDFVLERWRDLASGSSSPGPLAA